MTAREALARAAAALRAAGVPEAARDAGRLLDHHAGRLFPSDDVPDLRGFEALVARRARREPVSQITGRRAFWRHEFLVTRDVLDPRPETETLVAAALAAPFRQVLDLGTGSGCILLSLLAGRSEASGLGADRSDAALAVARENAALMALQGRATFARSDWFDGVEERFDLIVSNPPYIAEEEMDGLAPEPRLWEPREALCPGGDGLGAYRVILLGACAHLTPKGRILLEVGPKQAHTVASMAADAGFEEVAVIRDLDGRDRVVGGRLGGNLPCKGDSRL